MIGFEFKELSPSVNKWLYSLNCSGGKRPKLALTLDALYFCVHALKDDIVEYDFVDLDDFQQMNVEEKKTYKAAFVYIIQTVEDYSTSISHRTVFFQPWENGSAS